MTARLPLFYDGSGTLQEMSAAQVTEWVKQTLHQYATAPSAVLTVVSSSGANMTGMNDTRKKAGAASTSDGNESGAVTAADFVAEGSTAEPGTVTVAYDKINLAYTIPTFTADTNGIAFPVYQENSGGTIRSMTAQDLVDTFCKPAIDLLVAATESVTTAGTYTVTTSATSASNYTQVSSGAAFFLDTRANTGAYSAGGIPESLDQPATITSYFLHERDSADTNPSTNLLYLESGGNLREYAEGSGVDIEAILKNAIQYVAAGGGSNSNNHKIIYTFAGSGGSTRGSAVVDTRLNGAGNYQTRQVGNAYRSQEFPNGSAATITTNNLRITKG